jgi:hypothetical protein
VPGRVVCVCVGIGIREEFGRWGAKRSRVRGRLRFTAFPYAAFPTQFRRFPLRWRVCYAFIIFFRRWTTQGGESCQKNMKVEKWVAGGRLYGGEGGVKESLEGISALTGNREK